MLLLLVHAFATWSLVGLIWTIQLVHYRLFDDVGTDAWPAYHQRHITGITPLVGPLMLVELVTAIWLVARVPTGVVTWTVWLGLAMIAALWLSTAFVQVPMHNKLGGGLDVEIARSLTRSNWMRTFLWTARGLLAGLMIWQHWQASTRPILDAGLSS